MTGRKLSDSTPADRADPAHRRPWRWVAVSLMTAVFLFWGGTWWRARAASAEIRSLAVLPFVDATAQKGAGWLAEGLAVGIIDAMAHVPGLQVAARTSAFSFQGNPADIRAIGRQLGVAAVIEGTVLQAGDRLLVRLQMTRSSDGYRLWSKSFEQPSQNLNRLPQAIAGAMANRLQVPLDRASFPRHQPSQEAFDAFLQARALLDSRNPQSLDEAIHRLDAATGADPDFALAWAWLSIARESRVAAQLDRPNRAMPESREAAERAVALDPNCADAHLALGIVRMQYDWDWAAAKDELDRAIRMSPGSALALQWRARWYAVEARLDDAVAEMQRALVLDPLSPAILDDLAGLFVAAGHAAQAVPFARRAVELQPDGVAPRALLAEALFFAGEKEKSRQAVDELQQAPAYLKAIVAAEAGDPSAARQMLDEAEDLPDDQLLPALDYARLAAVIPDVDRLFAWMHEACGERDVELPYFRWNPLIPKDDPRFADFLEKMNLPAAPR